MADWLTHNSAAITAWCGAICTFAVYSVLYGENKIYRMAEHLFIGLASGFGVYVTWSQALQPKWWEPMVREGHWQWIFAAVIGGMFYFVYSRKHFWISRVVFGLFMGLAAGGMFREFYEIYFPQLGASMKPIAGGNMTIWNSLNVLLVYGVMICCMTYFFFSFEHKSAPIRLASSVGRWCLMIAFGAIFGATVMGRMTLFIGRFNFLLNTWVPVVGQEWHHDMSRWVLVLVCGILSSFAVWGLVRHARFKPPV